MLKLKIIRHKESYDFKLNPEKPDSFENNRKNNSIDDLLLFNNTYMRKRRSILANEPSGFLRLGRA